MNNFTFSVVKKDKKFYIQCEQNQRFLAIGYDSETILSFEYELDALDYIDSIHEAEGSLDQSRMIAWFRGAF